MRALVLVALLGCASKGPTPVSIVTPVMVKLEPSDVMSCWLSDLPIAPEDARVIYEDPDMQRRVFVHARQYNEMVAWARAMTQWTMEFKDCLETLNQ